MKKHDWTEQELLLLPRSAEAALTKGSKYYFTGQPCKRRHVAASQTDKKYCVECRREDGLAAAEKRRRRLGMKQWEDIGLKALPVGERSDRLTATGRMKRERFEGKNRKYTQAYDEVNCDCGHTFWLRRWYWGKQVQCRSCDLREKLALAHAAHSENSMFPHSSKHPRKARMLYAAHNRARKNGLEFDLTIDDIEIPDLCPVLGFPLAELSEKRVNSSPRYNAPSLDRIDPGIGYVRGNIVVMSYRANNIKKDGTAEEHLKVAEFMERMGVSG